MNLSDKFGGRHIWRNREKKPSTINTENFASIRDFLSLTILQIRISRMARVEDQTLNPNIIKDQSAGEAGIIVGDIAGETDGLINKSKDASYNSINGASNLDENYDESEYALPKAQLYTIVSGLFMASFLAALDTTVVTTLLTVIASDLNAVSNISWIATAYLLSCSAFQPLFGKLSDIFGRKILLVLCSMFFLIGCMVCVTDSLMWLVAGRFITGIGGSGLTTLGTITMSDLIPLRDRGLYQGLANVFFSLGAASGGILGGIVADTLGWKYVFILQVPLGALVGIVIWWNLNLPKGSPGLGTPGVDIKSKLKRIDFLGSFFLISSLMGIMIAASLGGREIAYNSYTFIGLVIVSLLLLGFFLYTEAYISAEPILPIELITERTILSSSLTNWFYTMAIFLNLYYLPVYFTSVMGFSATQNGLRLIPNFFGVSIGSISAGIYMKRTGRYYKLAILMGILSILGFANIIFINPKVSEFRQFTFLLPSGFGYAAMLTVTLLSLIAAVPTKFQACTTSIQYTFRSTGSTLGVSMASAIFQNILKGQLTTKVHDIIPNIHKADKIIAKALESTNYIKEAPTIVQGALKESYGLACKGAFVFSLATIVLGVACSLFMREHVLHSSINRG